MAKWRTTRAARQILRAAGGFETRRLADSGGVWKPEHETGGSR